MSSSKSFPLKLPDPTRYLRGDENLCDKLKNQDNYTTQEFAKRLMGHFIPSDSHRHVEEGIFAILGDTGGGKTFFLSLLYCELLSANSENYPITVHYLDALSYLVAGEESQIQEHISDLCDMGKTTIVLIDNIEKHSPQFIIDIIFTLDKLTQDKKLICILAYNDKIVNSKLEALFGSGNDTELFFQKYIDVEYYLLNSNSGTRHTLTLETQKQLPDIFKKDIQKAYDQIVSSSDMNPTQQRILEKKLLFIINDKNSQINGSNIINALYLIAIKLIDKEVYRALLEKPEITPQEIKDILGIKKDKTGADQGTSGHEKSLDPTEILHSLELSNVL